MEPWSLKNIEERLKELEGLDKLESKKARVRLRILDIATQHFANFGYKKANISSIAREAGIGKGSLYLHFKSKDVLLLACISREKLRFMPFLADVMELPPLERLMAYAKKSHDFLMQSPFAMALLRGDHEFEVIEQDIRSSMGEADFTQTQKQELHLVYSFIEPHCPKLSSETIMHLTKSFISAMHLHLYAEPTLRNGLESREFSETYTEILVNGILAQGASH